MPKRNNNHSETTIPLVSVQRFQPLKCDVNTRQLDELAVYMRYVESVGGEKPTEGEVVGVALVQLFKLDRGFQEWKDRSVKADGNSHRTTEPTPATRG
jgi:hypothetical protein